jgi:hypothetical protein
MQNKPNTNNNQDIDPFDILIRMKKLGKNQNYFASIHNRKASQVSAALNKGKYPGLLRKMLSHIEKLEEKQRIAS